MPTPAAISTAGAFLVSLGGAGGADGAGTSEGSASTECHVIPGKAGLIVQCALLVVSLTALGIKYKLDKTGRSFFQFVVDSSKQLAGAGWMHILNLFAATALKALGVGGKGAVDECSWYWIEIVLDTTVGVWIEYHLLHWTIDALRGRGMVKLADDITAPIQNGKDFSVFNYVKQVLIWMIVITGMKVVMVCFMLVETYQLSKLAGFILRPVGGHPAVKLVAVMIVTPAIMNTVQFWLVDNIFLETTGPAQGQTCSDMRASLLQRPGLEGLEDDSVWQTVEKEWDEIEGRTNNTSNLLKEEIFKLLTEREVEKRKRAGGGDCSIS